MQQRLRTLVAALAGAALAALAFSIATPVSGQQQAAYRAPRAADGHPDLNGIWQALNSAN
jgi:curli biogenesis system outer membrane secretion channel CsgG